MSGGLLLGIGLTVALVVALFLVLWVGQERIIFQPSGPPFPTPPPEVERLDFTAADGQPLFALLVTPLESTRASAPVLLAFHGNADLASARIQWAREIARRTGCVVALVEYRGYGGLPGRPTAQGVRLDARAALRAVGARCPSARIAYYGHSLGTAVAVELALEHPPTVLLLEAPFTSARDMARIIIARPIEWVWSMISRAPYDTARWVTSIDVPVWVAHGERDRLIPVRMGRAVHRAARRAGALLLVHDAGHNDVSEHGGAAYWGWIERALREPAQL